MADRRGELDSFELRMLDVLAVEGRQYLDLCGDAGGQGRRDRIVIHRILAIA